MTVVSTGTTSPSPQGSRRYDVVIAGGGQIGLTLAVALCASDPGLSVLLIDAKPRGAPSRDPRASAIAAAARRMLTRLGVWQALADEAEPVREMAVTDSRLGDAVRPAFLTFAGEIEGAGPFAHMVPNARLAEALEASAAARGVEFRAPASVEDFVVDPGAVEVRLADGSSVRASLLVAADGLRSRLRALSGIRVFSLDYPQAAIVANVAHELPHNGLAQEHFLPAGPFATLPLAGNRSSIVWTESRAEAARLVALDDKDFLAELEKRFGLRFGALSLDGPRAVHPLGLLIAREFTRPRFALLGDAAHGIHPIAGQGLNIGFRDVAALAETIVDARRLGLDIGAPDVLERYDRWRRFDVVEMGIVTDLLNRLFSSDFGPLRLIRDLGLGLVDRLPNLKRRFISEAAGVRGDLPKLLRGEAI